VFCVPEKSSSSALSIFVGERSWYFSVNCFSSCGKKKRLLQHVVSSWKSAFWVEFSLLSPLLQHVCHVHKLVCYWETATCCRKLVCCSVLQCVAVCCRVLQCFAVCYSVLQCVFASVLLRCTYVYIYTNDIHTQIYIKFQNQSWSVSLSVALRSVYTHAHIFTYTQITYIHMYIYEFQNQSWSVSRSVALRSAYKYTHMFRLTRVNTKMLCILFAMHVCHNSAHTAVSRTRSFFEAGFRPLDSS